MLQAIKEVYVLTDFFVFIRMHGVGNVNIIGDINKCKPVNKSASFTTNYYYYKCLMLRTWFTL